MLNYLLFSKFIFVPFLFKMIKNSIYGTFNREVRYDLQSVIIVCLGKNPLQTDNDLLGALETIFTEDFDSATKKKRLKENKQD